MKFQNNFERYAQQVNNCAVPGIAGNRVAIFVGNTAYTEEGAYTKKEIDVYINRYLIPWSFISGLYCNGMTHGSFAVERNYKSSTAVVFNTEDDYSVDVDIMNYTFACIAEAHHRFQHPDKKTITVIFYCGEAGTCNVSEYETEEDFMDAIADDLEFLEEREETEDEQTI